MKRDQFGRDLRKKVDGFLSSDRIIDLYQKFIDHDFNSIDHFIIHFADVENLTVSENPKRIYQFPKPTKEQIKKHNQWQKKSTEKAFKNLTKKPKKRINPMNLDRLKIESDYIKAKQTYMKDHDGGCDGCRTFDGMRRFSHRIPRSKRVDLIADINNLDLMCDDCHELVELLLYDQLINGQKIAEYVKEKDPEMYQKYLQKRKKAS